MKSYGDLVIAQSFLRRANKSDSRQVNLLLGDHLLPLNNTLHSPVNTIVVRHGEGVVPSLFDVRKNGWARATRSALRVRRLMREGVTKIPGSTTLVFDRIGMRERILAGGSRSESLDSSLGNIYLAYQDYLSRHGVTLDPPPEFRSRPVHTIGVFPGSRIPRKVIPEHVLKHLFSGHANSTARVVGFALEGESIPASVSTNFRTIPAQFGALRAAIESVDAVISADSLPAHLAEYLGLPVFVLTHQDNRYWLPMNAYQSNAWQTFDESVFSALPFQAAERAARLEVGQR